MYRDWFLQIPLQWHHNGHDGGPNHQPCDCLLNRLFKRRSKKTSMLRVTGLCVGKSPGTGEFPHKWPVTQKMFPFDDVIMHYIVMHQLTHITMMVVNVLVPYRCQAISNRHAKLNCKYCFTWTMILNISQYSHETKYILYFGNPGFLGIGISMIMIRASWDCHI